MKSFFFSSIFMLLFFQGVFSQCLTGCAKNEFCDGSNCKVKPTFCEESLGCEGVCGSDDKFYCNTCWANIAGIAASTGSSNGLTCKDFCQCTTEYAPVCGSNGVTYLNRCFALCDRATLSHPGFCGNRCEQPLNEGDRCSSSSERKERYYFDQSSKTCQSFIWSTCGGNSNNFGTLAECKENCAPEGCLCTAIYDPVCGVDGNTYPNPCTAKCANVDINYAGECRKENICELDPVVGPCDAIFPRYFFNATNKRCEKFTYGGCGGNENNFETERDCNNQCGVPTCICTEEYAPVCGDNGKTYSNLCFARCDGVTPIYFGECKNDDVCILPKNTGSCSSNALSVSRWFFNNDTQKCEEFSWNGCGGNANNFQSERECNLRCGDPTNECICPAIFAPVCGSDGKTYSSLCEARCANVEVKYAGPCREENLCKLPAEVGPCEAAIPRWFFNATSDKCERFIYGGCRGNANNFETEKECNAKCGTPSDDCICTQEYLPVCGKDGKTYGNPCEARCAEVPIAYYGECRIGNICELPSEPGPCKGAFRRWYYNTNTQKCEEFIYGGCLGNANNFETERECNAKCNVPPPACICPAVFDPVCGSDGNTYGNPCQARCKEVKVLYSGPCVKNICTLDPEVGPCKAAIPRWFFNATSEKCERFIYGGCRGNPNNFGTERECNARCGTPSNECICLAIYDPVCGVDGKTYPNSCTARCAGVRIAYAGTCEERDACKLKPDSGPCKGYFPRYFFNTTSKKCEKFIYGGCRGNANNFENEKECNAKCGVPSSECVCPDVYRPVCGFDGKTYGNPCEARCAGVKIAYEGPCRVNDPCKLRPDPGPCRAAIPRFYYNPATERCEQFTYGGCLGNANNFETERECNAKCDVPPEKCVCFDIFNPVCGVDGKTYPNPCEARCAEVKIEYAGPCEPENICELEADPGLCLGAFPRWFFNSKTGKCERFTYGGCGGNANNFENERVCNARCGKPTNECVCTREYAPVCGSDGKTYPNSCTAKCAGVKILYSGPCEARKVCSLPAEAGPCRGSFPRWFFNATSEKCERFIYGGCRGNPNNFETERACNARCGKPVDICICRAIYNPVCGADGKTYSNPCEAKCAGVEIKYVGHCKVDICELPQEVGPCLALIPRYWYNSTSDKCERFSYGGCRGNGNNFVSLERCEYACKKQKPCSCENEGLKPVCAKDGKSFNNLCEARCAGETEVKEGYCALQQDALSSNCELSPDVGTCQLEIESWYYNPQSKKCETFTWSGCGGNANNFATQEECNQVCGQSEIDDDPNETSVSSKTQVFYMFVLLVCASFFF